MKVSRLLPVVLFTACGAMMPAAPRPATAPTVATKPAATAPADAGPRGNADATILSDFKARVDNYSGLHKDLAKGGAAQKKTSDPVQIHAAKAALAARIQTARAEAKHGDIFTPDIRTTFRRLLATELKGEDGRDARAVIKDDAPAPGSVPFKVNAKYPEGQPLPSVPATLLMKLPTLSAPLEYRVVGQHLLLLDTSADLIVDYILNAIIT